MRQLNNGIPIKCDCGKLLARYEDGKILVYCRRCKQEHEIRIPEEPRAIEPRAVRA